jgi:hypothetical protein
MNRVRNEHQAGGQADWFLLRDGRNMFLRNVVEFISKDRIHLNGIRKTGLDNKVYTSKQKKKKKRHSGPNFVHFGRNSTFRRNASTWQSVRTNKAAL